MSFSTQELKQKKTLLQETLAEVTERYQKVQGTNSLAEKIAGTDLLSIREQIKEIDRYLNNSTVVPDEKSNVPRREDIPTTPTVLVDGIPPRKGVPSSAKIVVKPNGDFYYVDANGNVIARN